MSQAGRKKGALFSVDSEWKVAARARLLEIGMSQSSLASKIGVKDKAIARLLSPRSKGSTLVPDIHKAFGWDPPTGCDSPTVPLTSATKTTKAVEPSFSPSLHASAAQQLLRVFEQLNDFNKGRGVERMEALLREQRGIR